MEIIVLSLTSALNPTLLAATTAMLFLPESGRLMVGYWFGAMATSIASGLLLVYALPGSSNAKAAKHTLTPVENFVLAAVALILAALLATRVDQRIRERRATHRMEQKKQPRWKSRLTSSGSPKAAFVIGAALSLPGASYFLLLDRLHKLHDSVGGTTLILIGSNLVQLILLEAPMIAFLIWPERTPAAIEGAKAWTATHGRSYGASAIALIGVLLVLRGATRAW